MLDVDTRLAGHDRPVPYNLAAEEAVLGALLIDRDSVIKIAPTLRPEDFYRTAHGWIYSAILSLYARRTPPDTVLLAAELERMGVLEQAGNYGFLFHLVNSTPTAVHVEYYAQEVKAAAIRRRYITAGGQIAALGYEDGATLDELRAKSDALLRAVNPLPDRGGLRPLAELFGSDFDTFLDPMVGVPLGFPTLDRLTGGLQRPDLILLAARPGTGKTALALNIAYHAATTGAHVGFFSLEMGHKQIRQRLISYAQRIDLLRLRLGRLDKTERDKAVTAMDTLAALPLDLDDRSQRIADALAAVRTAHARAPLDLVIVDYLQLMSGEGERRHEEVSAISRALKGLAKELDVPVLALCQMNRAVEARAESVPQLSDLRESGSLEQDADLVWFLTQGAPPPDPDAPTPVKLWFLKHRNGPAGLTIDFHLTGRYTAFTEVDTMHTR